MVRCPPLHEELQEQRAAARDRQEVPLKDASLEGDAERRGADPPRQSSLLGARREKTDARGPRGNTSRPPVV